MANFENATLGLTLKVKDNLTQADLEKWETDIQLGAQPARRRASALIGAVNAAIIIEPTITLDTLKEWSATPDGTDKIKWYGAMLLNLYIDKITVPPN